MPTWAWARARAWVRSSEPGQEARLAGWKKLIVSFSLIYLLAILFGREYCARDPTSIFFRGDSAYQPIYSALRDREARSFIENASHADTSFKRRPDAPSPKVCLAIKTVARAGAEYFSATVGSLLDSLDASERDEVLLLTLIAHSIPEEHPAYGETWLSNLADEILTYDLPAGGPRMNRVQQWEEVNDFGSKTLWDQTYLLKRCMETGADYVLAVEDDIIAARGWYKDMKTAVREVEQRTWESGLSDFFYLRLFYTEQYLGWNVEFYDTYILSSVSLFLGLSAFLLTVRRFSPNISHLLTNRGVLTLLFFCLPLSILLFFAAGRITVLPQTPGVFEMNNYGCCSQAMLFPMRKVSHVIDYFEARKSGEVDMLLEQYADQMHESRWAVSPCLVQHVGGMSSRFHAPDLEVGTSHMSSLFNFAFEMRDSKAFFPWT